MIIFLSLFLSKDDIFAASPSYNIPFSLFGLFIYQKSIASFQKLLPGVEIITRRIELWNPVGAEATEEPEGGVRNLAAVILDGVV